MNLFWDLCYIFIWKLDFFKAWAQWTAKLDSGPSFVTNWLFGLRQVT